MSADLPNDAVPPAQRKLIAAASLLLAVIASGLAAYLAWHAFQSGPIAGCGAASTVSCDEVLATKWSKWFGIPVALFAIGNYVAVAAAALMLWVTPARWHRRGLLLLIPAAGLATAAAFWFTGLQLFTVQKLCPFCLATHACGLVIGLLCALLLLLNLRHMSAQLSRRVPLSLAGTGGAATPMAPPPSMLPSGIELLLVGSFATVAFVVLVGGQWAYTPKSFEVVELASLVPDDSAQNDVRDRAEPAPDVSVGGLAGDEDGASGSSSAPVVALKPIDAPPAAGSIAFFPDQPPVPRDELIILGNPDAEKYLIECVSYTCPTCRDVHSIIKELQAEYGNQLAVVLLPVPLERKCNPAMKRDHQMHRNSCKLTRLAIAVWELDREAFATFHDWLMTDENVQRYPRAWQEACTLVPELALIEMIDAPAVRERMARNNAYFSRIDKLPTIIVGDKMIKGPNASAAEELREFVRQQLSNPT